MRKHNYFVKFLKKINLSINNLLEKYLNKLKFSNLLNIARSNKVFLAFVTTIILSLSYLSIPHIYNKAEIQKELKNQLLEKFSVNFIFSKNFYYKFYPRPHFVIQDLSIIDKQKKISDIKKLKVHVSLNNLFPQKNIIVKDVIIENSNFNFNQNNYNFFLNLLDKNFLEGSFKIKNSNIFYRNIDEEVLFINKILNMNYYYDSKELKNILYSENKLFNIPFSLISYKDKEKIHSKINLKFLKLQIENQFNYTNGIKKGSTDFTYNKNKSKATYELNKNFFIFNFFDKLIKPNFAYEGKINFQPFYSNFEGSTNKINLSYFFESNSLFTQLFKTEILNNKNLNFNLNINSNKISHNQNIIDLFLIFRIEEGLMDIDNTKFSWNKYADFKILDSLLYVNNNNLVLDGKLIVDIINDKEIYKFLQTSKSLRPKLDKLELNFNYNFDQQIIDFNDIKINDKFNENVNSAIKKIILKRNKLQNKIYFKKLMKDFIIAYVG